MLCAKFGWKCSSVSGGEDFKKVFNHVFSLFCNYLLLRRGWLFIWKKLESSSPEDAFCQVWFKMAQWFWRRRFLKILNVLLLFHNYLPFEKGVVLHLNKLESPSPKNALCQVWMKLEQWIWRRRFFVVFNVFFTISQLSPLWEGRGPSVEQSWIPFTQGYFVPSLVEIGPWKCEKITDGWTDRRRTTADQKSSLELSAQVS